METLTREQLYERLWAEPATKVAASLGISSVMLGKIAAKLKVPTPPRGYWARRAAGQRVRRPALPAAREGSALSHAFSSPPAPKPPDPADAALLAAIDNERAAEKLEVPEAIDSLHPLLRRSRGGRSAPRLDAFVAIEVPTKATHERAVRVMHVLLHELERRGHRLEPKAATPGPRTWESARARIEIDVDGEVVAFALSEWVRGVYTNEEDARIRQAGQWAPMIGSHEYQGDGKLRLQLFVGRCHDAERTWRDDDSGVLEQKLNAVLRTIYATALKERQQRRERERWHREYEAQRRAAELAEARRAHEKLLRDDASERVARLSYAAGLRELIGVVEARGAVEELAWLGWARRHEADVHQAAVTNLPRVEFASSGSARDGESGDDDE